MRKRKASQTAASVTKKKAGVATISNEPSTSTSLIPLPLQRVKTLKLTLSRRGIEQKALKVDSSFWEQPCQSLALALLNKLIVREESGEQLVARIVETEAYLGSEDKASHSYRGETMRNKAMFMPSGTCYVYNIYGSYQCINVSAMEDGAAVLIRAAEPIAGLQLMQQRRSKQQLKDLCSGPSKLCQALAITKALDQVDLKDSTALYIAQNKSVKRTARIGLGKNVDEWKDALLRFCIHQDPFLSAK